MDSPLPYGKSLFVDGSSRCVNGKRFSGYTIINEQVTTVIEQGCLPRDWSAQIYELYALKRALDFLQGKAGTTYTDSKYAYGVVHTLRKNLERKGSNYFLR